MKCCKSSLMFSNIYVIQQIQILVSHMYAIKVTYVCDIVSSKSFSLVQSCLCIVP